MTDEMNVQRDEILYEEREAVVRHLLNSRMDSSRSDLCPEEEYLNSVLTDLSEEISRGIHRV